LKTWLGELPIEWRLAFSALPAGMFCAVVIFGSPVHWGAFGHRGPLLPKWEGRVFVGLFTVYWLKLAWAGTEPRAELRDLWFRVRHPGHIQSIFEDSPK
jgi:hypothetical protein